MDDEKRMQLAVNAAVNQASILSSNFRMFNERRGADLKRPQAWCTYGWPDNVTFTDFYNLYERQGVAYGVVHRLNEKCFETDPWVIQGDEYDESKPETDWEKVFRLLAKRAKFWRSVREADVYRLVGRYSALLLQIEDGKAWDQPVTGRERIRQMIPAWEGQLTPGNFVTDTNSLEYGEPGIWKFQEGTFGEAQEPRTLDIHPDRIVILGNWRNGQSFLKAAYNSFVNLEKIEGGSGESYFKNAARQPHINYDKDTQLSEIARNYGVSMAGLQDKLNEGIDKLNRGGDAALITQGATVDMLVAAVPDPGPHYNVSISTIAAATRIPAKVIVGMQTGERASTEDLRDFNQRAQGRRRNTLTDDIERLVNHLERIGVVDTVPSGEFTVQWTDLTESTKTENMTLAVQMADINQKALGGIEGAVFSNAQILSTAGYEVDDDLPGPIADPLPDADPDAEVTV